MDRDIAPPLLVDLALCQGHLRIATALLQCGVQPLNPSRARADALLHGDGGGQFQHATAQDVLRLLPLEKAQFASCMRSTQDESMIKSCANVRVSMFKDQFDYAHMDEHFSGLDRNPDEEDEWAISLVSA